MEDLTKQQLILLTLLLSFVTSIGTGIITVSLLDRAPDTVSQTINRVVEKTIENVVPKETTIKETEKITRVVVEKDDAITDAIKRVENSLVRIYNVAGESKAFSSLGIVVDKKGLIAIPKGSFVSDFKYVSVIGDNEYPLLRSEEYRSEPAIIMKIVIEDDPETLDINESEKEFTPVKYASPAEIGQGVIRVSGQVDTVIAFGNITSLPSVKDNEGNKDVLSINTDVGSTNLGSILINYAGEVIGINTDVSTIAESRNYMPAKKAQPELIEKETEPTDTIEEETSE